MKISCFRTKAHLVFYNKKYSLVEYKDDSFTINISRLTTQKRGAGENKGFKCYSVGGEGGEDLLSRVLNHNGKIYPIEQLIDSRRIIDCN